MTSIDQPDNTIRYDGSNLDGSLVMPADFDHVRITAAKIEPCSLVIPNAGGQPLVTIHPDGRLELGDDYQPDEAARTFWEAVQRLRPDPMHQQYGAPLTARINDELAAGQAAQKKVERLDQMAQAWADRLPENIRRDTVVDAIHQVTRG